MARESIFTETGCCFVGFSQHQVNSPCSLQWPSSWWNEWLTTLLKPPVRAYRCDLEVQHELHFSTDAQLSTTETPKNGEPRSSRECLTQCHQIPSSPQVPWFNLCVIVCGTFAIPFVKTTNPKNKISEPMVNWFIEYFDVFSFSIYIFTSTCT